MNKVRTTASLTMAFSNCLRHAFMSGAGYGDLEKIKDEDIARWVKYEFPEVGSFKRMLDIFENHPKDLERLEQDAAVMEEAIAKIAELREERDSLRRQVADLQRALQEAQR